MGNIRLGPDISRLGADTGIAATCIGKWRLEVADQWSRAGPEINSGALEELLAAWEQVGLEYGLLLYLVLGTEWMFRARRPTRDDLEEQLLQIEAGLSKPLHPALTPLQARLVVNAIESTLIGELEKYRFLLALRQWALPRPPRRMETGAFRLERPLALVEVKPGPIARIGPIVASVLSEDLLKANGRPDLEAEGFGSELARVLLRREQPIPSVEYQRWKARLEEASQDQGTSVQKLDSPANRLQALGKRWHRSYEIAMSRAGWDGFLLELSRDPKVVFEYAADLEVISTLYSVDWGTRDVPDRHEGNWGIKRGGDEKLPPKS